MSAPQKATGPDRANDQPRQESTHAEIVPEQDQLRKIESTLLAEFALKGHATHRLAEGGYLVCKHGHAKHCPDLRGLAAFARQVGVRS